MQKFCDEKLSTAARRKANFQRAIIAASCGSVDARRRDDDTREHLSRLRISTDGVAVMDAPHAARTISRRPHLQTATKSVKVGRLPK